MIAISEALMQALSAGFWHAAIVFLRVSALVSLLPAFGERAVPVRVKLGLAVAFTLIVSPAAPVMRPPSGPVDLALLTATEVVIGLGFGIAIRLFILALQTAGAIAAQATSLSQLLGGASPDPTPAMGYILVVGGLALAVMMGLHVDAARLLIQSYDLFPAGRFPDPRALSLWGLVRISESFSLAFTLAAPFVIASLIYNLALGVINRAMPQLMVAFVGAPVITLGGLFLLCIGSPLMLNVWADALTGFMANPVGNIR